MQVKAKQKARPFYSQFMESTSGAGAQGPIRTTRKAGRKGNDVDSDGDVGQLPPKTNPIVRPPRPPMVTLKAGLKGNDIDSDGDVGVTPGPGPITTLKAGAKGNDIDSDDDIGVSPPVFTTMKAGRKGNDVDSDADVRP